MAFLGSITSILKSRTSIVQMSKRCINTTWPLFFNSSLPLLAEPMKKKKKMDPAVIKAREERKKKRIEKTIKKLQKNTKQLKSLEEIELPVSLNREKILRTRSEGYLSKISDEHQRSLFKTWCTFKYNQHFSEVKMIDRISVSQNEAVAQLKSISEALYLEAIQMDLNLVPFISAGPTNTPFSETYNPVDGDYIDLSPKWV